MELKNTIIAAGLTALIAGCSTYNTVKNEEIPQQEKNFQKYTEASMRIEKLGGLFHTLENGSMVVEYFSHSLTPQNIKAKIRFYQGDSWNTPKKEEPISKIKCIGEKNRNSYFIIKRCDKDITNQTRRRLEMDLDFFDH
tara:strand:- start:463 stop:879 length:417 start_codon:yes stop_codon:yes gene_type:complete